MMRGFIKMLVMAIALIVLLIGCQGSDADHSMDGSMEPIAELEESGERSAELELDSARPSSPSNSSEVHADAGEVHDADWNDRPIERSDESAGVENTSGQASTPGQADRQGTDRSPNREATEPLESQTESEARDGSPAERQAELEAPANPQAEPDASNLPQLDEQQVYMIIHGEGEVGTILEGTFELDGDSTVLDLLKKVTREHKIQLEYRGGSGAFAYVEGIHNLYEFDHGPESGWLYKINDVEISKSAGVAKIEPGDRIEWIYVMQKGSDQGDEPS